MKLLYGAERRSIVEEKERKSLYWAGWILLGLGGAYLLVVNGTGGPEAGRGLPCLFHFLTGAYCPGCGGTRAVRALVQGEILLSLYYHPLVLYGAVLYFWFMVSNTAEYLSRGKWKIGMRYRRWYVVGGVGLLILSFIVKNTALLFFGYRMI